MRTRCASICLVLISVFTVTALFAQEPAAPAAPGPLTFASRIPADCDNLFVVTDVLPTLQRALGSDVFRRFAAESTIARIVGAKGDDLMQALPRVEVASPYIPAEIAVGFPSSAYADTTNLAKLAIGLILCTAAKETEGDTYQNEIAGLQSIVLESALAAKLPRMTAWVRFRDPQVAGVAFAALALKAPGLAVRPGIKVNSSAESISLSCKIGDMVPLQGLAIVLARRGLSDSEQDPRVLEIATAISKFEVEVWCEKLGDGIRLTLGPRPPENAAYPVQTLGALWRADAPPLVFGKWQLGDLKANAELLLKVWETYRDTEIGQAVRKFDTEDGFGNLVYIVERIRAASNSATFQVTATDSIDVVMHEQGFAPVASLANSPLVKLLPRGTSYLKVDAQGSLADYFKYALNHFESRLSKQQFKSEMAGDAEGSTLYGAWSEGYYKHAATFRRIIFDDAPAAFAAPSAIVVAPDGKIDELQVSFDAQGGQNSVAIRNAPSSGMAAIGRLADSSRPQAFFNDAVRSLLTGWASDVPQEVVVARDLGLGVETFAISDGVIAGAPANLSIQFAGDMIPHYFVIDGWIVTSTSVRLSKSVLEAWRSPNNRLPLPAHGKASLSGFGVIHSAEYVKSLADLVQLLFALQRNDGTITLSGPAFEGVQAEVEGKASAADVSAILMDVAHLVDDVAWTTVDGSQVRVTRLRVTFPAAAAK